MLPAIDSCTLVPYAKRWRGGDSRIRRTETGLRLALNVVRRWQWGCEPTLSDALIVAGRVGFGDKAAAHRGCSSCA
ncbi:MAG: hypothetical protein ACLR2G_09355 [Phascolarctobacterium faecium]